MKKISIIIPCYNVEHYIERCLESLVHQTIGIDYLELILVNDASTDDTLSYLVAYKTKYPESIIVIDCKENGRQGTARNLGLAYASAEYIGYVDADDWCESDMYERMYEKAIAHDCEMVMCKFVRDDGTAVCERYPENGALYTLNTEKAISDAMVLRQMGEGPCIRICKKSLLMDNHIYFAENLYYEDVLWMNLLYLYVRRFYVLDEQLYHYYLNEQSTVLTKNTDRHLDFFDVVQMLFDEYCDRGVWQQYPDAIQMDYIKTLFFQGLKMLSLRFDHPPFLVYQYIVNNIRKTVPNWRENFYIVNDTHPFFRRLLDFVDRDITEQEFYELIDIVKQVW